MESYDPRLGIQEFTFAQYSVQLCKPFCEAKQGMAER